MARYYGYYSTSQLQVSLKFLPGDGWAVGSNTDHELRLGRLRNGPSP